MTLNTGKLAENSTQSTHSEQTTQAPTANTSQTVDRKNVNTCPECDGQIIEDSANGERHCESCGVVVDETVIDRGPEWREYENQDRRRVGSPITERLHDRGLSTEIDWRNKDHHGNALNSRKRQQMSRLRTWNKRIQAKGKERNIRKGFTEIQRMSSALGLPKNVVDVASVILRRASSEGLFVGQSIEAIASAALYTAAQKANIPRTFDEIGGVSRIEKKPIRRAQTYLVREMGLELEPTTPEVYIPRFGSKLDAPQKHIREAERLTNHFVKSDHLAGRRPSSLAAVALYAAALKLGPKLTQKGVSEQCETTTVTIRNTYKLFFDTDPETDLTMDELEDMNSFEVAAALQK